MRKSTELNPIKFSERKPGINFPPLHPWCRCDFVVVVKDKEDTVKTKKEDLEKSKRDNSSEVIDDKNIKSDKIDFMGKSLEFKIAGRNQTVKAYKYDKYKNIYIQSFSMNAQKMARLVDENRKLLGNNEVVILKAEKLEGGYAGYDYRNKRYYFAEELSDNKFLKDNIVDNSYFAAESIEDIIKHESTHKRHWDKVEQVYNSDSKKYGSIERAKQELESDLRRYVVDQVSSNPMYIRDIVSENAHKAFYKTKLLNELIADSNTKHELNDEMLKKLARRCFE